MWLPINKTLTGLCSSTFWCSFFDIQNVVLFFLHRRRNISPTSRLATHSKKLHYGDPVSSHQLRMDNNLTWNTPHPDFTICFEKTILTWFPCAFLWVCSPFEIHQLHSSRAPRLPFHLYNISKLVLIFVLITTSLFDIVVYIVMEEKLPAVDIYTPVIKFFTFCLFLRLTLTNIKHGVRSSGILFMFSLLLAFSGAPQFRTELWSPIKWPNVAYDDSNQDIFVKRLSYLIYYFLVVSVFVLNCFADTASPRRYDSFEQNICPENESSFLSRIFFSWCGRLVRKGYVHTFSERDLWDLDHEIKAATNAEKFEPKWYRLLEKCRNKQVEYKNGVSAESQRLLLYKTRNKSSAGVSVIKSLIQTYGACVALALGARLLHSLIGIVCTLILSLILTFIENKGEFAWHGYLYMSLLLAALFLQVLLFNYYVHVNARAGYQMRTALVTAIYKKALRISSGARKDYSTGEIVNLMAVDAQKVFQFVGSITFIFIFVEEITLCVYLLWDILGPCILAGVAVMIAYVVVNSLIIIRIQELQHEQMKYKDKRVRLTNEILSGIRVLKLYAYEPSFERQIMRIRDEEIALLKNASYYRVVASTLPTLSSVLVSFLTFGLYVLSSEDNTLNPRSAFVSLSLFNVMKYATNLFPVLSNIFVQGIVAIKRIEKFLNSEEMDRVAVTHKQASEPIIIANGKFSWDGNKATPILRGINLQVKAGNLVAIVGPVGSGKSSLLSAILGEMYKQSGFVNTTGRLAYVPQQAWIQNATLRDNITFGDTKKSSFYSAILEACALVPDLEILPSGDQTEIGEKGINLSGGQKQRVSLARAVYSEADICLLDDPLSAVDTHVSKHIFEKVISSNGLLKNKTRIFVTHNVMYLPQVDYIVIMIDGRISDHGTYEDLLRKGDFSTLLLNSRRNNEDKPEIILGGTDILSLRRGDKLDGEEKLLKRRKNFLDPEKKVMPDGSGYKLIELEKKETGNVKWSVIAYYLKAFSPSLITLTISSLVLCQTLSVSADYWLSAWSNDGDKSCSINDHNMNETSNQISYLGANGLFGIGQVFNMLIHTLTLYFGMIKASRFVHNGLLTSVLHWPVTTFDRIPCGRILNRFASDLDVLDNLLPRCQLAFLNHCSSVVSSFFVISFNTPAILTIILPALVLYYIIQRIFAATSKQFKRMESISRSPIYSHFTDTVTGAQSIRAYNLQTKFIRESEEKIDANLKCSYSCWISYRWMDIRIELLGVVIVFAAFYFAMQASDTMCAALVGLSITYGLQVTRDMYWSLYYAADIEINVVAIERIKEYTEIEQEAPWIVPNIDTYVRTSWPQKGEIEFKNLEAMYRADLEPVLKGVTFVIREGEKVGVVGRTGAGKSSLTLCLFRIIEPQGGSIFVDGVDISTIGLHTLRSRMTIIPQDPVLFSGTLRMNLDPAERYSDEQLWKALELVNLKTFVSDLRADLYYEIEEGGCNFSVGQRQLICLARALLRKTKILILDEATASVDVVTDNLIQVTIRKEFNDCTVITIAHRLNTILDYDRVMVLDKGRIAEFDSPKVLLESKKSLFHDMAVEAGLA